MSNSRDLKAALILLTLISVVADTMLLPFYPQFFEEAFGLRDPQHIGIYIAACCVTVMCAFPLWSAVAKRVNELHLWVVTQIIAASLAWLCFRSDSLLEFWLVSQAMLVFKASYLLIYPFVMRLEEQDKRLGVAGLFSVLMHFGGIGGAVLGASALDILAPRNIYLIMGGADLTQVLICVYLIRKLRVGFWQCPASSESGDTAADKGPAIPSYVVKIGILSLLFYFSVFLVRPFFTRYWEWLSGIDSLLLSSMVYAIPAWIALAILLHNHLRPARRSSKHLIASGGVFILCGLLLQASETALGVVAGRIVFGYGLFQVTVHLEVLLFALSRPEHFARDFSKVHIFQNLGVIAASFAVGDLVDHYSLSAPYYLAIAAMLITLAAFWALFRPGNQPQLAVTGN